MKPMRTERLILRNWEDRDRDLFHRINSDERVMRFFPFRRDRAQSDEFLDRLVAAYPELDELARAWQDAALERPDGPVEGRDA